MTHNYFQKKHTQLCSFFTVLTFLLLNTFGTNAQTTIINPTTVGGFEAGATFLANGWTATAGTNKWINNTGATAGFTGARCAYINNTATNHNYAIGTASVSHFYRNITIPAGETNIALSFKWIGQGESCCDRLRVWVVPTTVTPVAGTAIVASGVAPTGNIQIGADMNVQGTWVNANLTLPSAYAGTTVRLVFEWRNDGSVGTQPPAAVDNISLISAVPPPPVNNTCATATNLPCATTNLAGSTVSALNIAHGTICSMSNYGVWYSFVGDGQNTTISSTAGAGFNHQMAISSGSCGTFTNIACQDLAGVAGTETFTFATVNLTTYYVYIAYNLPAGTAANTGTFTISRTCAPLPPTNDECAGAISLTPTSSCVYSTYTNAGATASAGVPAPGCASYSGGDVWFKFVVPANGEVTVDSQTGVMTDSGMAWYTGTCGALTLLTCDDDGSANGLMSSITQTGLTPGSTVYVRFWEYSNDNNGTFGICASSPTPITCYPPVVTANSTSTTSGTASWTAPVSAPLPGGYQYVISTSNTAPVGAGTPTAGTTATFTGLTPDTTYYVFVRSDCGGGDFSSWAVASFLTGYCTITSSGSTYYTNNFSTLGGITNITNNGSGFSAGGYGNFTAQAVSQAAGGSVSFSAAITGGTVGFGVWVDWNNDLDFNDVGEEVYMSNAFVSTATGFITVPATASVGNHRMRIVANSSTTVPSACGSGTNLEAEDYTFTVSPPLACSGNPSVVSVFIVSMTSSTISWTAATPAPASGYQYYLNTTGTPPVAATGATGTTAAGVTSATLTGLVAGTKYYVWVRSNCGGGTGQGTWVGPVIFTQPTCAVGPGTGTTTLGCPNTISGGLGLSGAPAPPINCSTAACANLEATFTPIKQTTSYTVASIAYAPPYQFNCLKNPVSVNIDDRWSPIVNLPFNFCFYGNTYNQCVIGSNGVLTFDTTKANTASGYSFANSLPSTTGALFANSIYGVYHDIDPSVSGEVGWELITLNTGCRALVASWNNVPMFSDNTILYTGMMVLYENTNIIEVYIKEKKVDGTWNGGNAIVGLQNAAGTLATVAPNRNGLDADWTATNEAWRFTPNGANVPTSIKWYEGAGTAGTVVGNTATISVCPAATTVYTAELTYTLCNGLVYSNTAQTTVTVNTDKTWDGSSSTDWNTAANWTPSGVPTATQSVNIPVTGNNPIVGIGANALACSVTVQNGAVLTINAGFSITVTNAVTVIAGGTFNIKNTGSLVQVNNVTNSGNINMERIANLRLQDYCYWSSPVGNLLAGTFPVQSVSPLTPAGYIYKWATTTANSNGGFGTWVNTTENMIPAKGYILRGPTGFTNAAPSALTANFIGVPNNGIFTPTISRGTDVIGVGPNGILRTIQDDNWNLIGNPYPSAIDALTFLNLGANNTIDGAIRIWTHLTLPAAVALDPFYGNYVYNYTAADYIVYNKLGAQVGPGGFNGKIAAGQSFLVLMNNGGGAPSTATVTFNNTMRSATHNNSQFYKNSDSNKTTEEQHRLWIDLIAPTGTVNRTLLGYSDGATQAKENLYDAITDYKPSQNFYSIIDEEPMLIQGRALPFDTDDIVPMGMKIPTNGTYHIAIAAADGLFTGGAQIVYLEDKLLNVIHNLTASEYQFTAEQGIINDRFVLRYTNQVLSATDNDLLGNNVTIFASNNEIQINSTTDSIKDYTVYNVLGQTLATKNNVNANQSIVNSIIKNNQTLIVKIVLENGQTVVKKIIF